MKIAFSPRRESIFWDSGITKSIEKSATNQWKLLRTSRDMLEGFFFCFWLILGGIWGSKIDEQTMKNDVKNKNDFKKLRNRFCIDFGTQLASWGGPRTPFLTFFTLLEPSWGEDGSRMRQDRFQDGFFTDSIRFIVFRWICHVLAAVSSYVKARSGLLCNSTR